MNENELRALERAAASVQDKTPPPPDKEDAPPWGIGIALALPRYKCHKEVHALKIGAVSVINRMLIPVDLNYGPIRVTTDYLAKHRPETGGYYVVYDDGYLSYSPAEPFEKGYTLIT
jgi:hypothetical protein